MHLASSVSSVLTGCFGFSISFGAFKDCLVLVVASAVLSACSAFDSSVLAFSELVLVLMSAFKLATACWPLWGASLAVLGV